MLFMQCASKDIRHIINSCMAVGNSMPGAGAG
jgi:hypothetical protein